MFENTLEYISFYHRTFARVAIMPYVGGVIAHTLRLVYQFPLEEAPFWIHWGIVVIGGYGVFGFILFFKRIKFIGKFDKLLYLLVIVHLGGSVILHAYSILTESNQWMKVFPLAYSFFAILYFSGLGFYCYHLSKRIINNSLPSIH